MAGKIEAFRKQLSGLLYMTWQILLDIIYHQHFIFGSRAGSPPLIFLVSVYFNITVHWTENFLRHAVVVAAKLLLIKY